MSDRERKVYLKLLDDISAAKKAVETIDIRLHELLDVYDRKYAKDRIKQLTKEGKLP